jgi:uncharacterized protein YukE
MRDVNNIQEGHTVDKIPNLFNVQREGIEKDASEIENVLIPKYKQNEKDVDSKILKVTQAHEEMENEGEKLRQFWQREVNRIFDNVRSKIRSSKGDHCASLKSHQAKLREKILEMSNTLQGNKGILQSNKDLDVTNYKSKILDYRNIPSGCQTDTPVLKTNALLDQEIRIAFGDFEAALTQVNSSDLKTVFPHVPQRIILNPVLTLFTVSTTLKPLFRIALAGTNEVWASGIQDKTIRRYDVNGTEIDTLATNCPHQPDDIAVTRDGDLVYTDRYNRAVMMVKHGEITRLFNTPKEWYPRGICCTKSGGFLVSVLHVNQKRRKVLRYEENLLKQEIENDDQGNRIFIEGTYMIFLTESNNGDICCSDPNALAMVVMDRYGHVRFWYDGQAASKEKPFEPVVIVTDSANRILVSDGINECIHVLNQDGMFLICLDNIGSIPGLLRLDSQERLWVGLRDEGKVNVIQYLE